MPNFLKQKLGPLPLGIWAIVLVIGFAGYRYFKNKKAAETPPVTFADPTGTGVDGISLGGAGNSGAGSSPAGFGSPYYVYPDGTVTTVPPVLSDPSSDVPVTAPPAVEKAVPWQATHPNEILPGQADPKLSPLHNATSAFEVKRRAGRVKTTPPGPEGIGPGYWAWDAYFGWRNDWVSGGTETHPEYPYHISGET